MKWFQHQANSSLDAKLQEVLLDYGLEGYGLYWYCLELVSMNVEATNLTFELEHDCRIIARNTGSTPQKVTEMMTAFVKLGLFDQADGIITCLSLMKKCDEYTNKLLKTKVSGQCRDKVRSNRIEEKKVKESKGKEIRIEDNTNSVIDQLFEQFWLAGMARVGGKAKTLAAIKTKVKAVPGLKLESFIEFLINDVEQRLKNNQFGFDRLHPIRYIQNERYNDDIQTNSSPVNNSSQPDLSSTNWADDKVFDPTYLER